MPGPSGRVVADWIAQARPEAKIIYLSGYTNRRDRRHGVLDPAPGSCKSRFRRSVLLETIRKALSLDDER